MRKYLMNRPAWPFKCASANFPSTGVFLFRSWVTCLGLAAVLGMGVSEKVNAATCPSGATCRYVSTSGNDSNSGSQSAPWKTLNYALSKTPAGGYIFLRRGDTWTIVSEGFEINKRNITLDAYGSGDKPVLSGNYYRYPAPSDWAPYRPAIRVGSENDQQSAEGTVVRNIEIKESGGECFRVYSQNTTLDSVFCNGSFGHGISFRDYANDSKLINSVTYNHNFGAYGNKGSTLEVARHGLNIDLINNRHGFTGDKRRRKMQCYSMWGSSSELQACNGEAWGAANFTRALRTQFINNVVYGGWGEGVIVGCGGREALIDHVTVADGKVGIYLDGGSGSTISNSIVMGAGLSKYYRGSLAGPGIGLNREPYCLKQAENLGRAENSSGVKIFNNIVTGRSQGLFFWAEVSTKYSSVKIYNNAFINNEYAVAFAQGEHVNTVVANNMFIDTGADSKVKGLVKGFGSDKSGFIFKNNLWSYKPEIAADYMAGSGTNSIISKDSGLSVKSGYFAINNDTFDHASWVSPEWVVSSNGALKSAGYDLSKLNISYTKDLLGNKIGSSYPIGPLISGSVSIAPPEPPPALKATLIQAN